MDKCHPPSQFWYLRWNAKLRCRRYSSVMYLLKMMTEKIAGLNLRREMLYTKFQSVNLLLIPQLFKEFADTRHPNLMNN